MLLLVGEMIKVIVMKRHRFRVEFVFEFLFRRGKDELRRKKEEKFLALMFRFINQL